MKTKLFIIIVFASMMMLASVSSQDLPPCESKDSVCLFMNSSYLFYGIDGGNKIGIAGITINSKETTEQINPDYMLNPNYIIYEFRVQVENFKRDSNLSVSMRFVDSCYIPIQFVTKSSSGLPLRAERWDFKNIETRNLETGAGIRVLKGNLYIPKGWEYDVCEFDEPFLLNVEVK